MPKQILPINFFEGGYNSSSANRDIEDNQITEATNVSTEFKGAVRCLGEWKVFLNNSTGDDGSATELSGVGVSSGGYGMKFFQVERELVTNEGALIDDPGGYYIAFHLPHGSSPEIVVYNDPQETDNVNILADAGHFQLPASNTTNSKVSFYSVDGALRIFDATFKFEPQTLWQVPSGRHYFLNNGNNSSNDKEFTSYQWEMDSQFVKPPDTSGYVFLNDVSNGTSPTSADINAGTGVGLVIKSNNQQDATVVPVGWGETANAGNDYYFFASFVYDGEIESTATQLQNTSVHLGGSGVGGGTTHNGMTFMPFIRPGSSASDWNYRITSIRIYYRNRKHDKDTKYFIGDFPTYSSENLKVSEDCVINSNSGYVSLYGDKNGLSLDGIDGNTPVNMGVYIKVPPTIFTHAVMSGMRNSTVSAECNYKTACVVNRKLYVGNVKQKTPESPNTALVYGDRMLKSVTNRFDCLPDSNFIDVNIKDGEDIIKLEAFNNRLLQFKERTLYVIVVAGPEEYLESRFEHMGILHPEACVKTEMGIAWVNKNGAYIFTGEGRPQSMTNGKIDPDEWKNFITNNSICGYDPVLRQLIVIKDCTSTSTQDETNSHDMYIHNMVTGSWNRGMDKIGDGTNDKISNIETYTDASGDIHTLQWTDSGDIYEWVSPKEYAIANSNTYTVKPYNFQTKEVTGGTPHLRKKFYKVYITYRGDMSTNYPDNVRIHLTGPSATTTPITLEAQNSWEDATTWKVIEFEPSSPDKQFCRNVYSAMLQIQGDNVGQDFEINDISVVFRPKGPK